MTMTSKSLKPDNGTNYGKLSNIVKDNACKQRATFSVPKICITSHPNSEIKAISDHKKHVSKTKVIKIITILKTLSKTWSNTVIFTK